MHILYGRFSYFCPVAIGYILELFSNMYSLYISSLVKLVLNIQKCANTCSVTFLKSTSFLLSVYQQTHFDIQILF